MAEENPQPKEPKIPKKLEPLPDLETGASNFGLNQNKNILRSLKKVFQLNIHGIPFFIHEWEYMQKKFLQKSFQKSFY